MEITKDTLINDIIENGKWMTLFVFHKYGMSCPQCSNRSIETLEDGARLHNVDINLLIGDLNNVINKDL